MDAVARAQKRSGAEDGRDRARAAQEVEQERQDEGDGALVEPEREFDGHVTVRHGGVLRLRAARGLSPVTMKRLPARVKLGA